MKQDKNTGLLFISIGFVHTAPSFTTFIYRDLWSDVVICCLEISFQDTWRKSVHDKLFRSALRFKFPATGADGRQVILFLTSVVGKYFQETMQWSLWKSSATAHMLHQTVLLAIPTTIDSNSCKSWQQLNSEIKLIIFNLSPAQKQATHVSVVNAVMHEQTIRPCLGWNPSYSASLS